MLITREIDYAVRIVRELSNGRKETIDEICRNELIPRQFSYKILKKLEQAGIVKIYRGAGGGYSLAKDLQDVTLFDVIVSINAEPLLSECLGHKSDCPMNSDEGKPCGVHVELERVQQLTFDHLKEKRLAELFY